jgi:Fe2+ transport system protein FeoA
MALAGRRKRARGKPVEHAPGRTLLELAPGERGLVTGLVHQRKRGSYTERLTALGVLPGVELEVIRRWPAVVFQLGHSQFAVDEELAGLILVQAEKGVPDGAS